MTITTLGIPPNEAQFLETRKFQVTEIARAFGVPPTWWATWIERPSPILSTRE